MGKKLSREALTWPPFKLLRCAVPKSSYLYIFFVHIPSDANQQAPASDPSRSSAAPMKWELRCILPLLLASASLSLSLPSNAPHHDTNGPHQTALRIDSVSEENFLEWQQPPHTNSTHHLIFGSVSGLLQRWPNTYRRNGAPGPFPFHKTWQPDAHSFQTLPSLCPAS